MMHGQILAVDLSLRHADAAEIVISFLNAFRLLRPCIRRSELGSLRVLVPSFPFRRSERTCLARIVRAAAVSA